MVVKKIKKAENKKKDYLLRIKDDVQKLRKDLEDNYETKGESKIWRDSIERRLLKLEKALV